MAKRNINVYAVMRQLSGEHCSFESGMALLMYYSTLKNFATALVSSKDKTINTMIIIERELP